MWRLAERWLYVAFSPTIPPPTPTLVPCCSGVGCANSPEMGGYGFTPWRDGESNAWPDLGMGLVWAYRTSIPSTQLHRASPLP